MSSREDFEKAIEYEGYSINRDSIGRYFERETQVAWEWWKAATERAAKVCDEMGDASRIEYAGHGCKHAASAIREGNE